MLSAYCTGFWYSARASVGPAAQRQVGDAHSLAELVVANAVLAIIFALLVSPD